MTTTTRFPPWMCTACGYMMDAVSPAVGDAVPDDGDACLCLNCGAVHVLDGVRWRPPTAAERNNFSAEMKQELLRHEAARRAVVARADLAKGGGRA